MTKIVLDTPTKKGLGFQDYADALVKIILGSGSPFTIGILGGWGVGKTSLMETMLEKLKNSGEKVIPIWFNAWRCEREKNLAIIPLLETLSGEIKDNDLKKIIMDLLKSTKVKFSAGPLEVEAGGGSQNQVEEGLYYDKLKVIENNLEKKSTKIVVFIDDIDRCAPDKILEVLESIKVFLDIKGFVYVLGLNFEVVNKAIEQKYKDMGIRGEEYLEKLVQIPFKIPDWDEPDIKAYLEYLIENEIDSAYQETFNDYKDIIQKVIERTPRQVKRFINTYICEHEVFKEKKAHDKDIHLILTILKFKWYDFYHKLFNAREREILKELLFKEELKDKIEKDLFYFINEVKETIDKIIEMPDSELFKYRRAGMIIPKKIIKAEIGREDLIELLKSGKVSEFNAIREDLEIIDLNEAHLSRSDLSRVNLSKANLKGADLSRTNLKEADLQGADLQGADLRRADLQGADLIEAHLSEAYLRGANLEMADLKGADLSEADLNKADLIEADLSKTNLKDAELEGAVIVFKKLEYQGINVTRANFQNAILNDGGFINYLSDNGATNVPVATSEDEIENLLEKRGYDSLVIERIKEFFEE